ncbi:MAG: ParB N-terminal domain-containing protein [Deltaproteobacteria bacterium]|nr:ParB N-terminal domain-containing protein [Deltaproteobacteria bacterium]
MNASQVVQLKVADISIPEYRKRGQTLDKVRELVGSIRELGLLNPISVSKDFELVSGLHRFAACTALGWTEIPACVLDLDALHLELAELDENLIRNELTALERGEQLARREEIYETLHPETRHGGDRKSAEIKIQNLDLDFAPFVDAREGEKKSGPASCEATPKTAPARDHPAEAANKAAARIAHTSRATFERAREYTGTKMGRHGMALFPWESLTHLAWLADVDRGRFLEASA